jgi:hypothetical protein
MPKTAIWKTNVACSVWLSLFMDGTGNCHPSMENFEFKWRFFSLTVKTFIVIISYLVIEKLDT